MSETRDMVAVARLYADEELSDRGALARELIDYHDRLLAAIGFVRSGGPLYNKDRLELLAILSQPAPASGGDEQAETAWA